MNGRINEKYTVLEEGRMRVVFARGEARRGGGSSREREGGSREKGRQVMMPNSAASGNEGNLKFVWKI